MQVLCRELYARLEEKFGVVKIANQGMSLQIRDRLIGYRVVTEVLSPGEYYRVNCPFCGDRKQRLWVNHRFAEYRWLAVCYNETRCLEGIFGSENRKELYNIIFNGQRQVVLQVTQGSEIDPSKPLEERPLPGVIKLFSELPPDHPSVTYLQSRGYDTVELEEKFGVGYCESVFDRTYYPLTNRIFIPIAFKGKLVGWQGRYIGDPVWKECNVQKYFNLRGMSKKDMLYNYDTAKNADVCVVVEGAADVWRVGPSAVALLGSDMSDNQKKFIQEAFADRPVAIFLDADAADKSVALAAALYPYLGRRVFPVISTSKDPGSMTRAECWSLINQEIEKRGLA
jgi:hypothetical protein